MRLLMLGPPGCGKGTQGARLAVETGIAHISSGDVLRAEIAKRTPVGLELAAHVARGDLVADDLLFRLMVPLAETAVVASGGYIADGFPRTLAQAERAHREIGIDRELPLQAVVSISVPHKVLIDRLIARGRAHSRADDTSGVIEHRLTTYHAETAPLIEYYRGRNILVDIDGDQPADEVYDEIKAALLGAGVRVPTSTVDEGNP